MLKCVENCDKKLLSLLYTYKFVWETKKIFIVNRAKELYCDATLYLVFDSLLSTCPKKM